MLIIEKITKTYRSGAKTIKALKDITLKIAPREVTVILGPNGAGKTTLFKIISGLIYPEKGRIIIKGKNNVAFVPTSERSFYFRLSGWENLYFFGALWKLSSKTVKHRVKKLLSLYPMLNFSENLLNRPYMTYSRGEKQKLNLLRAFIIDANILLLDEPTSFTNPLSSNEILSFIKLFGKSKDACILYATHNLPEAENIADRVILLKNGNIVRDLKRADLIEMGKKSYIKITTDSINYKKLNNLDWSGMKIFSHSSSFFIEIDSKNNKEKLYKEILTKLQRSNIVADITLEPAKLEHIFVKVMKEEERNDV